MKLLLDANISGGLVTKLKSHFADCFHVDTIGSKMPLKDTDIWKFALIHHLIIVTNDDGFLNLTSVKGFPPKVILLHTVNQSNNYLASLLIKHTENIHALLHSYEYGFLEIF